MLRAACDREVGQRHLAAGGHWWVLLRCACCAALRIMKKAGFGAWVGGGAAISRDNSCSLLGPQGASCAAVHGPPLHSFVILSSM